MDLKKQLEYLFNPKSVAVIGASSIFGKWGFNIMSRVLTCQDNRKVYAINKKGTVVMGLKAYRSLLEVPGAVEFAVITVPSQDIPAAMRECLEKNVKVVVIISGGLAESGEEGARVEQEVLAIAREGGIRFVGPNCLGHFDVHANFCTVPYAPKLRKGSVALISQSGNSSQTVLNYGLQMGLGFSKFVSSGNEADLHFEDYLEYLADDEKTEIILGYVEGFREGRRFLELARDITRRKPIVIMKGGRTDVGARAARSHSAALAGSDMVLDAAFRQCGVIRVNEITELVDVAVALLGQPLPRGKRVGVVAMGGGMAVMTADALRKEGLELPSLSPATMKRLDSILSPRWSHANPVDPGGDFVSYSCLWPMLEDENIDALILIGGFGMASSFSGWVGMPSSIKYKANHMARELENQEIVNLEKTIELMHRYPRPILFTTMVGGTVVRKGKIFRKLKRSYLNPYSTPEAAARVLAHLVEYSEYLNPSREQEQQSAPRNI